MALEIFKLVGSIFVDNEKANESISKTDEKAERLGKKLVKGVGTAAKWGAGLAAAAGAVGGAMIASAKSTAENLDTIDKAAKRMNMAAETYQEYAYAAGLCGVETSTLEKAAKKLEGTDINFDDAMESIMALGTVEERTAAASELFGDSVAYSMGPMLMEGADSMAAMKQEAHDLGLIMSEDAVAAGATMNDQFTKVQAGLDAMKTGIMTQIMPFAMKCLDWVLEHMPEIQETVGEVVGAIVPILEGLMPVLEKVFGFAGKLWDNVLRPTLTAITTFLSDVFEGNWGKIWEDIVNLFGSLFGGIGKMFVEPINWIIGKLNGFLAGINKIKIPDWVPGVGGKGFDIPEIPELVNGGILEKGQVGLLEGNGAEAVVPLDNNKKWISSIAKEMQSQGIGGNSAELIIEILKEILDVLKTRDLVELAPDEEGIFRLIRRKVREYKLGTGKDAFA